MRTALLLALTAARAEPVALSRPRSSSTPHQVRLVPIPRVTAIALRGLVSLALEGPERHAPSPSASSADCQRSPSPTRLVTPATCKLLALRRP